MYNDGSLPHTREHDPAIKRCTEVQRAHKPRQGTFSYTAYVYPAQKVRTLYDSGNFRNFEISHICEQFRHQKVKKFY